MAPVKKLFKAILIATLCLGGVVTLGGLVFLRWSATQFDEATEVVTDIERYPEIVASSDDPSMAHFPRQIPSHAKNVKFYFAPGFLQGGTILQLRMQLSSDEISALVAEFQPQVKRQYVPRGDNNSPKEEISPNGVNISFDYRFHTGDHGSEVLTPDFPSEYAIYVLEDTRGAPEYDWNHSLHYGVAINEVTSDVVYWLEDW